MSTPMDPLRKMLLQRLGDLPPEEKPDMPTIGDCAEAQTRKLNAALDRTFRRDTDQPHDG